MLYFITCPILDIPNILYVYYVHYATFQASSQNLDSEIKTDMDSTSVITESVDDPNMQLLRMHIQMNFHELQANDAVFNYEYRRVFKEVN